MAGYIAHPYGSADVPLTRHFNPDGMKNQQLGFIGSNLS